MHGASLARRVVVPAARAFAVCFPLTLIVALSSPRGDIVLHTGAPDSSGQGGSQGGWSSSSDLPVLGLGPVAGDPLADEVPSGVVAAVQPAAGTGAGGSFTSQGAGAPFGITSVTTLTSSGIPVRAYQAYLRAQSLLARDRASCHLQWSLVAGIGRVESNHGRFGGAGFAADGRVVPPILGMLLDGHLPGTAVIRDSDRGVYDGNASYDRAVGPMQFLPQTWKAFGGDANGDGRPDPQQMDDAAYGTGKYLCAGGGDLSTFAGQYAAVYRYNHSDSYVRLVLSLAATYATGRATTVPDQVPPGGHDGGSGGGAGPDGPPPGIGDGGGSTPTPTKTTPSSSPSPTTSSPSPTTTSPSPTTSSPTPTTPSPTRPGPTDSPTGAPTPPPTSPTTDPTTSPSPTTPGTTPTSLPVSPTTPDPCLVTPNPTDTLVTPTVPPGCPTTPPTTPVAVPSVAPSAVASTPAAGATDPATTTVTGT